MRETIRTQESEKENQHNCGYSVLDIALTNPQSSEVKRILTAAGGRAIQTENAARIAAPAAKAPTLAVVATKAPVSAVAAKVALAPKQVVPSQHIDPNAALEVIKRNQEMARAQQKREQEYREEQNRRQAGNSTISRPLIGSGFFRPATAPNPAVVAGMRREIAAEKSAERTQRERLHITVTCGTSEGRNVGYCPANIYGIKSANNLGNSSIK